MSVSLVSDFTDFYDECLTSCGHSFTFNRMASRVPRIEALRYLSQHKNTLLFNSVVPHGAVSSLRNDFPESQEIVVYGDMFSLGGVGLTRTTLGEAQSRDNYCSLFIPGDGLALKHLVVGNRHHLILRKSRSSWKSNTGEVICKTVAAWSSDFHPHFPLYAVSYIGGKAIHLDTAPRLKGLVDLSPEEVSRQIIGWFMAKEKIK